MASYIADTNILLRGLTPADPPIEVAIERLVVEGHELFATTQNFIEAWNVLTRLESQNGFGMTAADAAHALRDLEDLFPRLPDQDTVFSEWKRIVHQFDVRGVQVHDARLVAVMLAHGIRHILTLDTKDFRRYASEGIVVVDPRDLVEA